MDRFPSGAVMKVRELIKALADEEGDEEVKIILEYRNQPSLAQFTTVDGISITGAGRYKSLHGEYVVVLSIDCWVNDLPRMD